VYKSEFSVAQGLVGDGDGDTEGPVGIWCVLVDGTVESVGNVVVGEFCWVGEGDPLW